MSYQDSGVTKEHDDNQHTKMKKGTTCDRSTALARKLKQTTVKRAIQTACYDLNANLPQIKLRLGQLRTKYRDIWNNVHPKDRNQIVIFLP